jgi:hypothetical protein
LCKTFCFLDARTGGSPGALACELGHGDDRALAPSNVRFAMAVVLVQDSASPLPSCSAPRFSG